MCPNPKEVSNDLSQLFKLSVFCSSPLVIRVRIFKPHYFSNTAWRTFSADSSYCNIRIKFSYIYHAIVFIHDDHTTGPIIEPPNSYRIRPPAAATSSRWSKAKNRHRTAMAWVLCAWTSPCRKGCHRSRCSCLHGDDEAPRESCGVAALPMLDTLKLSLAWRIRMPKHFK